MTQFLPPNLLALFAPRDPVPYLPPVAKLPHEKKTRGYLGVGSFMDLFEVSMAKLNDNIKLRLSGVLIFTTTYSNLIMLLLYRTLKTRLLQQKLRPEKND